MLDEVSDESDERDALEATKRASVGHLLFRCARLLNERALVAMRASTGKPIRAAHTSLFPHIDLEGTRLTEIARRMGISKQAVGQLVAELEEMGGVERVPDPEDGRAKLVRFTRSRCRSSLFEGFALLAEVEADIEAELGTRTMNDLRRSLAKLLPLLERA
jgi:DNA-binding MarR family transcriptional regulator